MMFIPEAWATFFNTTMISYKYIYLDIWSVVHLFTGMFLGLIFLIINSKKEKSNKFWFILTLSILVLYEVFEYRGWDKLFYPEPYLNIIYDLIMGMLGFTVVFLLGKEIGG